MRLFKYFLTRLWQQGRRFRFAAVGTILFLLFWAGQNLWQPGRFPVFQWNILPQGMVAIYAIVWLSVPWKLYRENRHVSEEMDLRGEAAALLAFLVLWRTLEGTESITTYMIIAFCLVPVFSFGMILYLVQRAHGSQDVFPYFVVAALKCVGIAFLLQMITSVCMSGFSILINMISPAWFMWLNTLCQLGVGFLCFLSYIPEAGETVPESRGYKKCWQRLLLPGSGVLLAILYLYLGKILWTRTMPVGLLNWFASIALFVYAWFYFSFARSSEFWAHKVLQWGGLALIPVLAAQGVGVWIRLSAYGLTTLRYLSLVLTAYGILVLLWGLRRQGPAKLYALGAVLAAILAVTPANLIDVPAYAQYRRLMTVLAANALYKDGELQKAQNLSADAARTLRSAYEYLSGSAGWWRYPVIEQMRTAKYMERLPRPRMKSRYLNYHHNWKSIPVEGKSKVYLLDDKVLEGKLRVTTDQGVLDIDLTDYLQNLVGEYPSGRTMDGNVMTVQRGNYILYIRHLAGQSEAFEGRSKAAISLGGVLVVKEHNALIPNP